MTEYVDSNVGDLNNYLNEISGIGNSSTPESTIGLSSEYDGIYQDYFRTHLTPNELLGVANWAKDAETRIQPCVAAYEQEQANPQNTLVASRAAEIVSHSAFELGKLGEARVWALRAVGALTAGATSFDAVPGPEQEAITARLTELRVVLAPQLQLIVVEA